MATSALVDMQDNTTNASSRAPSSRGSNIEGLIESVQARSMATTEIRLGNKLAKPFNAQRSPTMGFMFSKPVSANSAHEKKQSGGEKELLLERNPHQQDHSGVPNNRSPARVVSRQQEKILKLSEPQRNSPASPNNLSKIRQSPVLSSRKNISSDINKPSKSPIQTESPQGSTLGVDTSTLLKILAFSYHRETKQDKELIKQLRSEYTNRAQELIASLTRCQRLEQSLGELQDEADYREREIESLKQRLADTSVSVDSDTKIEHCLISLDHKLDKILQVRRTELGENAELGKALGIIRQMADELRQYRTQSQKPSPKKAVDAAVQTNLRKNKTVPANTENILRSPQAQDSRASAGDKITNQSAGQQHDDNEDAMTGNISHNLHKNNHHEDAIHGESLNAIREGGELSLASTIKPVESVGDDTNVGQGLRGANKFGKRAYDTISECSQTSERRRGKKSNVPSSKTTRTPSKRVFLRSSSRSMSITELNPSHAASASRADLDLSKAKPSRGPAAKWRTIFDLASSLAEEAE